MGCSTSTAHADCQPVDTATDETLGDCFDNSHDDDDDVDDAEEEGAASSSQQLRQAQLHRHRVRNVLRLKPRNFEAAIDQPTDEFAARVAERQLEQRARVGSALANLRSRSLRSSGGTNSHHNTVASTAAVLRPSANDSASTSGLQRFDNPLSRVARRPSTWYDSFAGADHSTTAHDTANNTTSSVAHLQVPPPPSSGSIGGGDRNQSPVRRQRGTPTVVASSSPLRAAVPRSSVSARRGTRSVSHVSLAHSLGSPMMSPHPNQDGTAGGGIGGPGGVSDDAAAFTGAMDESTYRAQSVFDFPTRGLSTTTR